MGWPDKLPGLFASFKFPVTLYCKWLNDGSNEIMHKLHKQKQIDYILIKDVKGDFNVYK